MNEKAGGNFLERKFSVEEAAIFLGIHQISVRRRIADGAMGAYRFGDRVLIGESHLSDYVARSEQKPRAAKSTARSKAAL